MKNLIAFIIFTSAISIFCFGKDVSLLKGIWDFKNYKKQDRISICIGISILVFIAFTLIGFFEQPAKSLNVMGVNGTSVYSFGNTILFIIANTVNSIFTAFILIYTYITHNLNKNQNIK